jgi:hypothetical protein
MVRRAQHFGYRMTNNGDAPAGKELYAVRAEAGSNTSCELGFSVWVHEYTMMHACARRRTASLCALCASYVQPYTVITSCAAVRVLGLFGVQPLPLMYFLVTCMVCVR